MAKSTPEQLLRSVSEKLGLPYEPQDWGIVNADGNRLDEFIAFLREGNLEPTQQFELASLILASANERLIDELDVALAELFTAAAAYPQAFSLHMEYWLGLPGNAEFPLAQALREAG